MLQNIKVELEAQEDIGEACCKAYRFFNLSLDMLVIGNLDGYFIDLNPAWERTLGFTPEELTAQPFIEFIHPEDGAKTTLEMGKLAEGIPVTGFENRYRCKDGSYKYLAWTAVPFLEEGLIYAIARDVTERKQTEAALRENQRFLQEILDTAPMAIYLKDLQGRYLLCNRYSLSPFGLNSEQVIGKSVYDFFCPEIADLFQVSDRAALEAGGPVELEEVFPEPDGLHTYITTKFPIYDTASNPYAVCGISVDITQRKLAEIALKESEERFRQLAENIEAIFWVCSLEGEKMLYVSPAYEKIWGCTTESLYEQPQSWQNLIHPEDLPLVTAAMEQHRQGEFPERVYRILRPDGSIRWIQDRIFPVRNSEEQVYRLCGIAQDITERQQAETDLQESEERFRQLAENTDAVVWMWSLDEQQTLYLSPAYEKIWGRSSKLVFESFQNWLDTIHPEDRDKISNIMYKRLIQGHFVEETYRIIKPDGSVRWINGRAFPIYNSQGKLYRSAGIAEDITDRLLTEAALKESEQKYRNLIETSQGLIWSLDREGRLTFVNQVALEFSGYKLEEIIGKKFSEFTTFTTPEQAPKTLEIFESLYRGESILQYEGQGLRKNGTQFWLSCNMMALRDDTGNILGITGTAVDITERKKAEEQLKLSLQEKEALLKEVHHRVKNNLQVISSLLDLQSQQIQDPVTLELFRASQNRVQSIALIHEKLYQSENLARVNLAEYIQSLTSYLLQTYPIDPNNITLQLQVKQIFLNLDIVIPCGLIINELVSNALKHGFPGNTKGTIWICLNSVCLASTEKKGQHFTLVIGNNGMKLEDSQKFYRPKSLGFQLVNALVKQLQGTIEITPSPSTEFKLKFSEINH